MAIDLLPNECLLEIFSFVDAESLKEAAEVCRNWNELIGSSAVTMKKFSLRIDEWRVQLFGEKFPLNRKYFKVVIHYGEILEQVICIIKRVNVSQAEHLSLYGPEIEAKKVSTILSTMPLLKFLHFHPFKVSFNDESSIDNVKLSKLKELEIDSMNCKILNFINAKQVTNLEIHGLRIPTKDDAAALIEFLKQGEKLEDLELNEFSFNQMFTASNQTDLKLQLSKFELSCICTMLEHVGNNFNEFLITLAPSLTCLNLMFIKILSTSIYKTIFNKLTNLSTIYLNATSFPTNIEFYDALEPTKSVMKLKIDGSFQSIEAVEGFMGKCPNIQTLKLNKPIGDGINCLAVHNKYLTKLELNSLGSSVEDGLEFHNLKFLSVASIANGDHWISLIMSSPAIESLEVRWVDANKVTEIMIDVLLQRPTLRNLKFDGDYDEIKIIFDKIKMNFGNLKSLNLTMYNTSEFGTTVSANVKFEFPNDPSEWNLNEQEDRFDLAWDHRSW